MIETNSFSPFVCILPPPLTALEEYSEAMKKTNKNRYSKKINDAKNFIDHNLSMDFALKDIANFVKMNPSYLSRLFKRKSE